MGTWEEIKLFLLPPRIGTAYPSHTRCEFHILCWNVEFLNGMSDFNRFELELWASIGLFFLLLFLVMIGQSNVIS